MKKLILFFILSSPLILSGQPSLGDGSSGNPYRGTLSSDWTFSGDKYFGKLNVISGTFTISSGSFLRFGTGDTLSITGNGVISAIGTSTTNRVTFTASGTSWGHIYIYSSSPSNSELKFCLIEKGDVTLLIDKYGGGIRLNSSNILLENCEIKNNKATHGGGIFVGKGVNPTIKSCYIHNNQATASGGGAYFWTNSYSLVDNCIVTFNTSGSGGGGGIFLGGSAKDVTIVNSVISSNTASSVSYGHNIRFNNNTNNPKPKFINSIIWYPANSIVYLGGGSAASADFENCAIQTPPITYTNCITLNAVNTNPAGPNFIATDGSDWSLQYWSPCLDIGLNNSENSKVPLLDFSGNSRVGRTDAGAYEYQFFVWQGDDSGNPTSWNTAANWYTNTVPTGNEGILIQSGLTNYPTGSSPDYTIASGKSLILKPGAKATFGTLTNNGTLRLESDATSVASLITDTYSGNDANVELNLPGGPSDVDPFGLQWHYISTPVDEVSVTAVFEPQTYNIVGWYDSRVNGSLAQGWVGYDGWLYYTEPAGDGPVGTPEFYTLQPGYGYNYYDATDQEYTLTGQINTGDHPMTLTFAAPQNANLNGYNLLGNPFTSGLDWQEITYGAYAGSYPANTGKVLHYNRNNEWVYYINNVGTPSDVSGVIPPMQGFFVKTYASSNSINLTADAQTHDIDPVRYKGAKTEIPLLRLSLTGMGIKDETVIRFDAEAKTGLDYDFDAVRMDVSLAKNQIYTVSEGSKFVINGQPYPGDGLVTEIPITINLLASGIYTINRTQLQALDGFEIYLKDKISGVLTNLKISPNYQFTGAAGNTTDRFVLVFNDILTGNEEIDEPVSGFNVFCSFGEIIIEPIGDEWNGQKGSIKISDLSGKMHSLTGNHYFSEGSVIRITAPTVTGVYFVEIQSGLKKHFSRVVVR